MTITQCVEDHRVRDAVVFCKLQGLQKYEALVQLQRMSKFRNGETLIACLVCSVLLSSLQTHISVFQLRRQT